MTWTPGGRKKKERPKTTWRRKGETQVGGYGKRQELLQPTERSGNILSRPALCGIKIAIAIRFFLLQTESRVFGSPSAGQHLHNQLPFLPASDSSLQDLLALFWDSEKPRLQQTANSHVR